MRPLAPTQGTAWSTEYGVLDVQSLQGLQGLREDLSESLSPSPCPSYALATPGAAPPPMAVHRRLSQTGVASHDDAHGFPPRAAWASGPAGFRPLPAPGPERAAITDRCSSNSNSNSNAAHQESLGGPRAGGHSQRLHSPPNDINGGRPRRSPLLTGGVWCGCAPAVPSSAAPKYPPFDTAARRRWPTAASDASRCPSPATTGPGWLSDLGAVKDGSRGEAL